MIVALTVPEPDGKSGVLSHLYDVQTWWNLGDLPVRVRLLIVGPLAVGGKMISIQVPAGTSTGAEVAALTNAPVAFDDTRLPVASLTRAESGESVTLRRGTGALAPLPSAVALFIDLLHSCGNEGRGRADARAHDC